MAKIIIDPRIKYNYATYYLKGLYSYFGKQNIEYNLTPFTSLHYDHVNQYNQGMAFVIQENGTSYKIFIDTEDKNSIAQDRYDWCDLYAKANPNPKDLEKYSKLHVLGTMFGIQLQNSILTSYSCLKNYIKGHSMNKISFKSYLKDYAYSIVRRRGLDYYSFPSEIQEGYVFHASMLWYDKSTMALTNDYRGMFLKACKTAGLNVEGRLFYLDHPSVFEKYPEYALYKEKYKDFIFEKRISMKKYLQKTKESLMVFNVPSVCGCHGWKLGEYLCMGKAIISTPVTNALPGKGLVHEENVHMVHSIDEILPAVKRIAQDKEYRLHLEKSARAYYEEYMAPRKAIELIYKKITSLS